MENLTYNENYSKTQGLRDHFKADWAFFLERHLGEVILNNSQPRLGKTVSSLEYCESNDIFFLFITDSHKLIYQIEKDLKNDYIHFEGQSRLCNFKHDENKKHLIEIGFGAFLCRSCTHKKNGNCHYHNQFIIDTENPKSILVTKKQLPVLLNKSENNRYDFISFIIFDEKIEDGTKIEPTIPEIKKETFEYYGVKDFYPHYEFIHIYKDSNSKEGFKKSRNSLKDIDVTEAIGKIYYNIKDDGQLLNQIMKDKELENDTEVLNLLNFFLSFNETVHWMALCCKKGYHPYFPKTYLEFAHDLKNKYNTTLTVLNASVKHNVLEYILKDFVEFKYPLVENKNNILFRYSMACNKSALFKTNSKGQIILDESGTPLKNYQTKYTMEVFTLVEGIIDHCNKKNLKVGIITYKAAKIFFEDKCDVTGHFQGVQGSNEFDDVDVLVVLGTFNLPLVALANKTYFITGDYKDLEDIGQLTEVIIGQKTIVYEDEDLNKVKEFKKDEEHEQALLRSGAHIEDGKIVFAFGYVPERVEELFDYREIRSVSYKEPSEGSEEFTRRSITNLKGQMTRFFKFR